MVHNYVRRDVDIQKESQINSQSWCPNSGRGGEGGRFGEGGREGEGGSEGGRLGREVALLMPIVCACLTSSSQYCVGQRLAPHIRTLGDLEWEVEATTVTHSSADWWDLLLPLA